MSLQCYNGRVTPSRTVRHTVRHAPIQSIRVAVVEGPDVGKNYTSAADTISIGSEPGNDFVLTDKTVSRYHLELQRDEDRVRVLDHGSTNGTWSGTTRLEQATIGHSTILRVGRTLIEVKDGEPVDVELYPGDELHGIRARSAVMRRLMAQVVRVAKSRASVLLLGETGTGKELFARAVHKASLRCEAPFEVVDCAALVPTLVASELFGHERGAFTGAHDRHVGAFERANGGTVFLDEIGELPPPLQTQLLGVLERKTFRRVGGTSPIEVDVRVVAATHRDLRQWVNKGDFRQDLYYRIAVARLRIPSLRERASDIPLLVRHFLDQLNPDRDPDDIMPPEVIEQLKSYHWPGNIRELRNFAEAALAFGEVPDFSDYGEDDGNQPADQRSSFLSMNEDQLMLLGYLEARDKLVHDFQRRYLIRLLERSGTNMSEAARKAKMNRSHLLELLKRHDLR